MLHDTSKLQQDHWQSEHGKEVILHRLNARLVVVVGLLQIFMILCFIKQEKAASCRDEILER